MSKTATVQSTSGHDFKLLKGSLKSDTYVASRKEIAKAFQIKKNDNTDLGTGSLYVIDLVTYRNAFYPEKYTANVVLDRKGKSVSIGCQDFTDKNYTALRQWALAE